MILSIKDSNQHKNTIGGKARGLSQLTDAGLVVPDFVIIPAETFDSFINKEDDMFNENYNNLLKFSLDKKDKEALQQLLIKWNVPKKSIIVRSSIADEDGVNDAFAGIMESFCNLTSCVDIEAAIGACAASAFSAKAFAYRQQKGLSILPRPAIIIQKQILADVSGVIFSTYPIFPQEMAIHAVWGLGEGLVGGTLNADEYYVLKSNSKINRTVIATKEKEVAAVNERGSRLVDVPKEKINARCLSDELLIRLFSAATSLEEKLQHPQDIEFVVFNNEIIYVQTRPITQSIPEIVVYDNSNIQESYCGVTTPLTYSFAQRAYATVYRQTMTILSLPQKTILQYDPVVNNLLGLIKGRIYYNINNWYRGLQLLPSFKQNKEDMERMMGVEEPVDFIVSTKKTFVEKFVLLPSLLKNLFTLLTAFSKLKKSVSIFKDDFETYFSRFYQVLPELKTGKQILIEKQQLDKKLLQNWTTPIINDFYVMMMNGKVRRKLLKLKITEPEEFLSRYLSGNQQIESAQPAIKMQALAILASQQPLLKNLIVLLPDEIDKKVLQQFPEFYKEVVSFINAFGDRTVGELKLETITMRLSPKIFYSYLRNYLVGEKLTMEVDFKQRKSAELELNQKLKSFWNNNKNKECRSIEKLKKSIQNREAMRLERTRLFGMYRALYLAAGQMLCANHKINNTRDIFYLTENEIEALLLNECKVEVKELIEEQRTAFEQYRKEDVPARVIVPSPPGDEIASFININNLKGTGCVPGDITAEVIVITSPEENLDVSGKIVCALRTDPGWVALFPACKGVLIEKGSALSHSVILLREFGIPSIINIPGLTKNIKSGQKVKMNGTTGEVKII